MVQWYWDFVVSPVIINIAAAVTRVSAIGLAWSLMSWWARHFGVIRLAAAFHLKPLGAWIALLARGPALFRSPYANDEARSELERRRRAKREHTPAAYSVMAISVLIFLVLCSHLAQATDVLFAKLLRTVEGLYPSPVVDPDTPGNVSSTVPAIGIALSYAELAAYCSAGGVLSCPSSGPWWDKSYQLMRQQVLPYASLPPSIPSSRLFANLTWSPSGIVTKTVASDGSTSTVPTLLLSASAIAQDPAVVALDNMTLAIPLVDSSLFVNISRSSVFVQSAWQATAASGAAGTPMLAETLITLASPFDAGSFSADPKFSFYGPGASQSGSVKQDWLALMTQQSNSLGQGTVLWSGNVSSSPVPFAAIVDPTVVDVSGAASNARSLVTSNATIYGGALCATANFRDGSTFEMLFVTLADPASPALMRGVRGLVWNNLQTGAHESPLYVVAKAMLLTDVEACRVFDIGMADDAALDAHMLLVARCSKQGSCRVPTIVPVPRSPQPVISLNFNATVFNVRNTTTAAAAAAAHTSEYYINYTPANGANMPMSRLWMYEPGQTFPGVCDASTKQCSGVILPVWLVLAIVVLVILTEVAGSLIEEIMDIVIYGFLSTTGPYLLSLGPAVFSYDSLVLARLTSRAGYIGVQPVGQHTASFHISRAGSSSDLLTLGRGKTRSVDHLSNPDARRPLTIRRVRDAIPLAEKDRVQLANL
ncbi:hypothetical protein HK105_201340 [Polyrhizophydium stewartii]|uniref:Transmembrane protein n=1 Tax=Polyrhizophydium stewartii TaxID=2732419 RepID=A0ABR4NHR3_9FUNG|nr:hypothetical protein HK105_000796 [Polyrhizophydium stewartii]